MLEHLVRASSSSERTFFYHSRAAKDKSLASFARLPAEPTPTPNCLYFLSPLVQSISASLCAHRLAGFCRRPHII